MIFLKPHRTEIIWLAHDTNLHGHLNNVCNIESGLTCEISKWVAANKMTVNTVKFQFMAKRTKISANQLNNHFLELSEISNTGCK